VVKQNQEIKLSFILPIYNEEVNLEKFIEEYFKVFQTSSIQELIVVDDNSTDNSFQILMELKKKFNFHIIKNEIRKGRGRSFKDGLKLCRGKYTGYMDSDLQIHPQNILRGINLLDIGISAICGKRIEKKTSFLRRFLTLSFKITAFCITGLPCKDPLCGFKLFFLDDLSGIIDRTRDEHWFFDYEIMYYARKKGLKIGNLPVVFIPAHELHVSKTRYIKDSIMYFKKLILLKIS